MARVADYRPADDGETPTGARTSPPVASCRITLQRNAERQRDKLAALAALPIFGATMPNDKITFSQLLQKLNFTDDEFLSVCHRVGGDGALKSSVCRVSDVQAVIAELPESANVFFGVNPTEGPARKNAGRGKSTDVTRLSALIADLDITEGKCADTETAHGIIDELSGILSTRPTAITYSGGGLHPYWPVLKSDDDTDGFDGDRARAVLARWKRLVKMIAAKRGARVDSVFDAARVLRVPGTYNHKTTAIGMGPIRVDCRLSGGQVLTLAEIEKRIDAYGIHDIAEYPDDSDKPKSDPHSWVFADETCSYVAAMVDGWADRDSIESGKGRHQWLLSQSVRMHCAHRLGCVSAGDFDHAKAVAGQTFRMLRATRDPVGSATFGEVEDAWEFGRLSAAAKTKIDARTELGDHAHVGDDPYEAIKEELEAFWNSSAQLRDLRQFAQARLVGPAAMLGAALARVISHIPPNVVLPPTVGSYASLNLFVAIVGKSGESKSAAIKVAREWLSVEPDCPPSKPGSGEGLAKCFAYVQKIHNGGYQQIGKQWSVLAVLPEIETLTAIGSRGGATIMSALREGWSGERLGNDYATEDKRIVLHDNRYRLCFVVGVQPEKAAPLLADADGGTPQRFVWFPITDGGTPDVEPPESPKLDLGRWPLPKNAARIKLFDIDEPLKNHMADPPNPDDYAVLKIPDSAKDEIKATQRAIRRGDAETDPLDGHRLLVRLKLSAALMALESRYDGVTQSDWERAGVIMKMSDATRRAVIATVDNVRREQNVARGRADGQREIAKSHVVIDNEQKIKAMTERIIAKLKEKDGQTKNDLRKALTSNTTRDVLDESLTYAERLDMIRIEIFQTRNKQDSVRVWLP